LTAKSPANHPLPAGSHERDEDLQQQTIMGAYFSKKLDHVVLANDEDARLLESKGFGIKEADQYYLKDYEVLYLMYNEKLALKRMTRSRAKKTTSSPVRLSDVKFTDYVSFSLRRDENAWTRFLIFRDLRSRGYVVREGFGFPIDFRVYDRGDYGTKAAKYIVFGLNEGKTMSLAELRKHVEEMSTMGKEAVIAVVERRGEVIYYKVAKWRPIKPF
jgi:tRNA-intron endonuclease, archaea type